MPPVIYKSWWYHIVLWTVIQIKHGIHLLHGRLDENWELSSKQTKGGFHAWISTVRMGLGMCLQQMWTMEVAPVYEPNVSYIHIWMLSKGIPPPHQLSN